MAAPMNVMASRSVRRVGSNFGQHIKVLGQIKHLEPKSCIKSRGRSDYLGKYKRFQACHALEKPWTAPLRSHKQCQSVKFLHLSSSHPPHTRRYLSERSVLTKQTHWGGHYCTRNTTDISHNHKRSLVLGIESSCDDTGAAVVDQDGNVVGEALNSQTRIHVEMGGIIPHVARDLHRQNIESVVEAALRDANVSLQDLDAIACTVKPGLMLSLDVGTKYAQKLVRDSRKPFIPIHHMEAHALTARMIEPIPFPFLVLLISGGHCLLAVARDVDDFLLLGTALDDAPGDAFDKTARKLKLKNLAECSGLSGGAAIEKVARGGDPRAFPLTVTMGRRANCDFSFAGIKEAIRKIIEAEEAKYGVSAVDVLPSAPDVCASFQFSCLHHLARRLQRALLFSELKDLLPRDNKTLVVSGGVGSNQFIRQGLEKMCAQYDCRLVCPPPKLCTDNGIMIAWNGMEKWKIQRGILPDAENVDIQARAPLGRDIREEVEQSTIKLKRIKLI